MQGLNWLMGASAVVWIGLSAYVAWIGFRQHDLKRRLDRLESTHHE